ncbi:hypothetical protein V8E52_002987, partial [Russula decolorans]
YEASAFAFWITSRSGPIFYTRLTSSSSAPIPASRSGRRDPILVFEDRYSQPTVCASVRHHVNIYGRAEVVSGGHGAEIWNRDQVDRLDKSYGFHPFYLNHRWDTTTGLHIILASHPSSNQSLIQYRIIDDTLDLYFVWGWDRKGDIEQYGQPVGLLIWPLNVRLRPHSM